jgi:hypothetical protein
VSDVFTDDLAALSEQAERIVRSGALGRSRSYVRLLEFLVDCARAGRTPKELEIAMEVFGKSADFDPSQDSLVRVYAHNLRQKLEQYYGSPEHAAAGRLVLARGEYRVSFARPGEPWSAADAAPESLPVAAASAPPAVHAAAAAPPAAHAAALPHNRAALAAAAAVLLALGGAFGWLLGAQRDDSLPPAAAVARSPLWAPMFDDDLPILVTVGDYYIFGETDDNGEVVRLVREFDINSRRELDDLMMYEPEVRERYMDLDLTYLPRGSAFALLDILRVLYTADKPLRVVSMSELNVADVKSSHVVYIGYLSALDKLQDFVFASSSLAIGDTYDELRNKATGALYASEGGAPDIDRNYRDYSFISGFPGPGGNQFMIVAGTRDAGLMQSAHALTDPVFVRAVEQALPKDGSPHLLAFEQLYEVMGFNRTNLDARLVHEAPLDYETIWGGTLLTGN